MSASPRLAATVLVPAHNHGQLLTYAVQSALHQTIADLEVFIVGDGVDDKTRAAAAALVALDSRVRFFDWPKGERHGEALRHTALQEARGDIICYLSDDDLWLPRHVEGLSEALRGADFAHALPVVVDDAHRYRCYVGHLSDQSVRDRMQSTLFNFIPLSAAAHTREFYYRLPRGWHPAPREVMTDLHMWRQVLAVDGCRPVSSMRTTLLNFPAPPRRDWSRERRRQELATWSERLGDPDLEREISAAALDVVMRSHVERDQQATALGGEVTVFRAALTECHESAHKWLTDCQDALAQAELRGRQAHEQCEFLEAERTLLKEQHTALAEEHHLLKEQYAVAREQHVAATEQCTRLEGRCAMVEDRVRDVEDQCRTLEEERDALEERQRALDQELRARQAAIERVMRERDHASAVAADRQRVLTAMETTITWRARNRLLTMPLVASLVRRRAKPGSAR
jgi:GalNAc5-diNAcBac-PP-undecaprenol beta-1,3-glucosyltransferase